MDKKTLLAVVAIATILACTSVLLVSCQVGKTVPVGGQREADISREKYREVVDWLLNKDAMEEAARRKQKELDNLIAEEEEEERLRQQKNFFLTMSNG